MTFGIQQITIILLIVWFLMFVDGKIQQSAIKKKLFARIHQGLITKKDKNPDLALDEFYEWVFSNWDELVKKNAWFILSKSELYPISANPDRVMARMNLTPAWLGDYLKLTGKEIKMTEEQPSPPCSSPRCTRSLQPNRWLLDPL
jgi:hypothetical protein